MARCVWMGLLVASLLLAPVCRARADRSLLSISTEPSLPTVLQRNGRVLFGVDEASQVMLHVRSALDGGDLTSSCTFTSVSPEIAASPEGMLSFSAVAQETLAAVAVECPGAREIVGFLLTPGSR